MEGVNKGFVRGKLICEAANNASPFYLYIAIRHFF